MLTEVVVVVGDGTDIKVVVGDCGTVIMSGHIEKFPKLWKILIHFTPFLLIWKFFSYTRKWFSSRAKDRGSRAIGNGITRRG